MICLGLAGCGASGTPSTYVDGTYTAEFREFDTAYDPVGYKDYLRVVVKDGVISEMEYDAVNPSGERRSQSEEYEAAMLKVSETMPRRYSADLVNQFLEEGGLSEVDDIAGATWSSASFKALFTALEANLISGDTNTLVIDNIPAK